MQSPISADQIPANAVTTPSLSPQLEAAVTGRQIAELREALLAHQVNPLSEDENNRVPYSELND